MKIKIILTIACAVTVGLSSCKKTGDFTTDRDTYEQGEVITVTNTTEKASSFYKWDFGGTEIEGENPIYTIPENTPVGSFTISMLPVNNLNTTDNWKRTSRTVNITEAIEAKVIFFLPTPNIQGSSNEVCTVTLEVQDISLSKSVSVFPAAPDCESSNNLNAATFDNLGSGTYNYTLNGSGSNGSYFLSGSVTLDNGFDCRIIDISQE